MALTVVQVLLDTFVEDVLDLKERGTDDVTGYLEDQLAHYSRLLTDAELELAEFKREYVGLLPGESGGIFERLQREMDELRTLRSDLRIEEDRRTELRRQLQSETPYVADDSDESGGLGIPGSTTESEIEELVSQRATLLLRFTERHPDVIAIEEQLNQLYLKRDEER